MIERIPIPPAAPLVAKLPGLSVARGRLQAKPITNQQQLMADLSEELSFSVGESEDYNETDAERITDEHTAERAAFLRRIEKLQGVYRSAYSDAEEHFKNELRRHDHHREALEEFLRHPTDDSSLSWHLLTQAQKDGTLARALGSQTRADDFLHSWIKQHGVAVQAGLNNLDTAQRHQPNLGQSLEVLQNFYQKQIAQFTSVVDVLAHMAAQFGVEKFDAAKSFLAQAVQADFTAAHPSRDKVQLLNILDELKGIKSLNTIRWKLNSILERFQTPKRPSLNQLTQQFVVFLPAPLEQSAGLFDLAQPATGEQQVVFLQGLVGTVRTLSADLFAHADMRARAIAALQQRVDDLVLREGY